MTMFYNSTMKTIIIVALIFLDIIPHSIPLVSDTQKNLENKVKVEKRQVIDNKPQLIYFSPLPNKTADFYNPSVGANAYEAIDMGTGEVLLEHAKDGPLQIASLTKLMTARLLLKDGDLNKTVVANDLSKVRSDDSKANLILGDELAYRDILQALLINSASDAAITIANNLYSGGYNEFVNKMNEEAKVLGLKNTHYDNPVGWDSSKNYSSPEDLAVLTRILLKDEEFRKIVSTRSTAFTSEGGYTYPLQNTNVLLNGTTVFGVKTGTTLSAGQCLIALTKVKTKEVLVVLLGASDRFYETNNLLSWGNLVYNW